MHHQVVVLAEEIGSSMTVEQLSWMIAPESTPTMQFTTVDIWMGLCGSDVLNPSFLANYIPGTRTLVYHAEDPEYTTPVDEWFTIELDTAFEYDGSENLLIEIDHQPYAGATYCWSWECGEGRAIGTFIPDDPTGDLLDAAPMIILTGGTGLDQTTFGSIKTVFLLP